MNNHRFKEIFGDLPERKQEHLYRVLNAMTKVINNQLRQYDGGEILE